MNSLGSRRILRSPTSEEDVFVIGETVRVDLPANGEGYATVTRMMEDVRQQAEGVLAEAHTAAEAIVANALAERDSMRTAGRAEGFAAAQAEAAEQLALIRVAASEGIAIRDAMIAEGMPAIARAIAMATRRVVGAAYEADPALVADAVSDAVRAAAGQQILAIRVSPDALDTVRAALVDVADYVRADTAVEMGGCIVDLRGGTIDATLDARLNLMELALRAAGGGGE